MQFYKAHKDRLVCLLCSYYCKLKPNQVGICGVNKNTGDKIECLVYGRISALNIDPIEKKPLYHFLPQSKSLSLGTVGCNFKCSFCQNHGISQEKNINTSKFHSAKDVVNLARKHKCESISYTYNEPTIFYPYAKDIAIEAKKYGIKSVYVSNGFESSEVIDDMKGVIDAVNIDLKCFNEKYYKKELGGRLEQVLKNLKHFKENVIWVEVTTLIVPSKNDSSEELEKIAKFIKEELDEFTPWHISSFHPDFKEMDLPRTPYESLKMAYDIGRKIGLKYVYIGNIGFENSTICPSCEHVQIKRKTYNILENRIFNGKCYNCGEQIHGVYEKMTNRKMAHVGRFYPSSKKEILEMFDNFNKNFTVSGSFDSRAAIVPHAGYIYSGFTANIAYKIISEKKPKNIIVIGPSHRVYLEGASISLYENYLSPLGQIKINTTLANALKDKYSFLNFNDEAHSEHSTETQASFIKHYFPNSKILEIVYGKMDFSDLALVIDELLEDKDNFVLISTDLSHFLSLEKANKIDNYSMNAIVKQDLNLLKNADACGKLGVMAMTKVAKKRAWASKFLNYTTSYNVTKDDKSVVGYTSFLIGNDK